MGKKRFPSMGNLDTGLLTAIVYTVLHQICVLLPTVLLLMLAANMIQDQQGQGPLNLLFQYWGTSLLFVMAIFVSYGSMYKKLYLAGYEKSYTTRVGLAEKIRQLPLSYFKTRNLSELTSTLMEDTAIVEHSHTACISELVGGVITSLLTLVSLVLFQPLMGISLFVCLPLSALLLYLGHRIGDRFNRKSRDARLAMGRGIQELLENMRMIQTSAKGPEFRRRVEKRIKAVGRFSIVYELVLGIFINGAYNGLRVGLAAVVATGGWLMARGEISVVVYLTFLFVAARIYDPLTQIFVKIGEFSYALVSARRIESVMAFPCQSGEDTGEFQSHDLVFDKVCFSYGEKQVIHDVSFTAPQGRVTALVGPSGSGKSTLTRLAARFWDIDTGQITIGGRDISAMDPEHLLQSFSMVLQEVVLFNDTSYNHIALGKKGAAPEEIYRAARLAQCESFIRELPLGYDTVIGENGKTLSGGERQRLSIARAFLKDAPIILLDEATASLDPENETLIQAAIGRLIAHKTVLIIAHRLRSVVNCDRIVVLDQGRVAETGSHGELSAARGLYAHLYERQRENDDWAIV